MEKKNVKIKQDWVMTATVGSYLKPKYIFCGGADTQRFCVYILHEYQRLAVGPLGWF